MKKLILVWSVISVSKFQMFDTIVVYSSDTDALLLFLDYHHHFKLEGSTCTVFCKLGMGPSSKIYNFNVNAWAIGLKTCFSMLLQSAILYQAFSTIARRVCGKPGISIQITTAWPRYSKLLEVHINEFTRFNYIKLRISSNLCIMGRFLWSHLMLWGWTNFNVLLVTASEHFLPQEMIWLRILNLPLSRVVLNGEHQLRMWILQTQPIGLGDSFIINIFQNDMTVVIQLTLII